MKEYEVDVRKLPESSYIVKHANTEQLLHDRKHYL